MAEDTEKVPAQEVLGTAWEKQRKCRRVDETDLRIEVAFVNPDRTQEQLTPLLGVKADRDDLAKLYGPGRFFLKAFRVSDGTVISQSFCDIKPGEAPDHPMSLVRPPEAAGVAAPERELEEFDPDDRVTRLEQAIEQLTQKLSAAPTQPGQSLMDRLMEKVLMERISTPPPSAGSPEVFGEMLKNALSAQSRIFEQTLELKGDEKRFDFELRQQRALRQLDREDQAFQVKQRLLLEQAKSIQGQSSFDPEGGNTLSLLEAIQDVIGLDKGAQIFGFNIAEMLEPIVPQITKALQDRGIFILAKKQLELMLAHQFEQGKAAGAEEALTPDDESPEETAGEGGDGSDGGSGLRGDQANPGPDDQLAGGAGGAGEPEA